MGKEKISEYCKRVRLESGLNVHMFSVIHKVSRQYISKIESGELDEIQTLARIRKFIKTYNIDFEELNNIDINEDILKVLGIEADREQYKTLSYKNKMQDSFRNDHYDTLSVADNNYPYSYFTSMKAMDNLMNLKAYLESCGYYDILTLPYSDPYNMVGVTPTQKLFVSFLIQTFSTGMEEKRRKKIILNNVLNCFSTILEDNGIMLGQPLEVILFTSGEKTFDIFKEFKDKRLIETPKSFFSLKVIYIFQNRTPEELVMFEQTDFDSSYLFNDKK